MLSLQTVVRDVVLWLLDVRERVRRLEGEVALLRGEVARMHKEVVKLRNKVRYEELVAKEANLVFSEAGAWRRRGA
jgi:hypothetical protein